MRREKYKEGRIKIKTDDRQKKNKVVKKMKRR